MNSYDLFSLSLDIGEEIISNGGEISRAKDTIKRLNSINGNDCTVLALPDLIIAQSGEYISARKINESRLNMAELERLNSLSRRICENGSRDINITVQNNRFQGTDIIFNAIAVYCFCLFFGGDYTDSVISSIIGAFISYAPYRKKNYTLFTANLIDAFIAGAIANISSLFLPVLNTDKIIIGAIMILVPGINIQNAIRDMVNGETLAGAYELLDSIFCALAIALAIAASLFLFSII